MRAVHQLNVALGEFDSSQFYTAEELWPYLTETDRVILREEVSTAINHELAHAEDLEAVVPRLLRSCTMEAQELRRAIKSMASSQMLEGHRAVQIVKESGERVQDLRELFIKQGAIISQMNVTSESYKQLRELHYVRSNVSAVIEWVEVLKELRCTDMYELVEQRQFAAVYKRLCRLQSMRQTVVKEVHSYPVEYRNSFDPYFEKLELVQTMFVDAVYKLFREKSVHAAIQKALEDPPKMGVVAQSIPEFTQLEECVQLCAVEVTEDQGFLNSSDGQPLITEGKIFDAVADCTRKLWNEDVMAEFAEPIAEGVAYLNRMKKVAPVLLALEMTLIPLSTSLSLFAAVVATLHGEVVKVLELYADQGLEVGANDLIAASDFLRWYKEMLKNGNYSSYVDIAALDKLSARMTAGTVDGLMAHLMQLCRTCARTVLRDGNRPSRNSSGLPVTTGPKDMFAVLQQTLSGLSTATEVGVMRQIGKACAAAIDSYFQECKLLVDYDNWEQRRAKSKPGNGSASEEWKIERLAFLYAFCNDCLVIECNMDTIELMFVSYWDEDDDADNASPFVHTQRLTLEHASYYIDEIILHVERVVEGQWSDVFRSSEWYSGDNSPTLIILDTIADFIDEEFTLSFEDSQLRTITHRMMRRYIQRFLTVLMEFLGDAVRHPNSRGAKDWNEFVSCFYRDIVLIVNMWKTRIPNGRRQLMDKATRALELIKGLLAVNKPVDFDFIVEKDLLDDFGDCPTFVVRFLLLSRKKDIGEDACSAMLALWEERIAHQQRDSEDKPTAGWKQPPSFFGMLDRSLADIGRKGGLFSTSPTKKRKKAEQKRQKMEKERRKVEHEKQLAEAENVAKLRSAPAPLTSKDEPVEVVALASVLGTDEMKGSSAPCLVDIAVNLTDCVFRGVDWKGRRVHNDNFDEVMRRAEEYNVRKIIVTGTSLPQCLKAIRLCRRYPSALRCTVGVHPAHCAEMKRPLEWSAVEAAAEDDISIQAPYCTTEECSDESLCHAEERMNKLVELVNNNRDVVVAVGEIGLDYAELSYCPKEVQKKYFILQLRAFRSLGLPFLFHSRDCGMDFVELIEGELRLWPPDVPFTGVVHSYNGPLQEQTRLLDIPGMHFSINGSAFREKDRAEQVCRIPRNRLLLETDAPWCDIRHQHYGARFLRTKFPTNRKGKPFDPALCNERRTEPCHLRHVLEAYVGTVRAMGEETGNVLLQNMTEEEAQEQFYQTCVALFAI